MDAKLSPADKAKAIKAWHDATTDAAKKAAVKDNPCLVEMYASAVDFVEVAGETKPKE